MANTTANYPRYGDVPLIGQARVAAANTARDGSGTLQPLVTAGSDGTRIERVTFTSSQATAATSSAMVGRLFLTDTSGSNPRMLAEVAIPTATATTTAIGATALITFPGGLIIPSGTILKVAQSVYAGAQDQMDVTAYGANF